MRGFEGQDVTVTTKIKAETEVGQRGQFRTTLNLVHTGSADLSIRYELAGPEDAPLLLVAGGIPAGRHVIANACDPTDGWWQAQANVFRPCRLLSIDWLGADGTLDRPIDSSDPAQAVLYTLSHPGAGAARHSRPPWSPRGRCVCRRKLRRHGRHALLAPCPRPRPRFARHQRRAPLAP